MESDIPSILETLKTAVRNALSGVSVITAWSNAAYDPGEVVALSAESCECVNPGLPDFKLSVKLYAKTDLDADPDGVRLNALASAASAAVRSLAASSIHTACVYKNLDSSGFVHDSETNQFFALITLIFSY